MHKTFALVQARLRSSRLPGKALMSLQGMSIIEIILKRLKKSKELDGIIVLTSTEPEDDALAYAVEQHQVPCFRGSEDDVLDRYYQAARYYDINHIVRITGDCPLIDPGLIDRMIKSYHQSDADLITNQISNSFPDGLDVCIFSFDSLQSAWENAKLPSEREHVVPWILEHARQNDHNSFKALDYPCYENLSDHRWTLDEAKDYMFLQELTKVLPMSFVDATWEDVLQTIQRHPEIKSINHHISRNEGYQKSLGMDREGCL